MKTLKKIMMALCAFALLGMTVACSKDDDKNNGSGDTHGYSALLVGTWQADKMYFNGQDVTAQMLRGTIKLYFYQNGTGLVSDNGEIEHNDFTWAINGETITITTNNKSMDFTINSLTATECTFSGSNMEMDGQMIEGEIKIHMTKVPEN